MDMQLIGEGVGLFAAVATIGSTAVGIYVWERRRTRKRREPQHIDVVISVLDADGNPPRRVVLYGPDPHPIATTSDGYATAPGTWIGKPLSVRSNSGKELVKLDALPAGPVTIKLPPGATNGANGHHGKQEYSKKGAKVRRARTKRQAREGNESTPASESPPDASK